MAGHYRGSHDWKKKQLIEHGPEFVKCVRCEELQVYITDLSSMTWEEILADTRNRGLSNGANTLLTELQRGSIKAFEQLITGLYKIGCSRQQELAKKLDPQLFAKLKSKEEREGDLDAGTEPGPQQHPVTSAGQNPVQQQTFINCSNIQVGSSNQMTTDSANESDDQQPIITRSNSTASQTQASVEGFSSSTSSNSIDSSDYNNLQNDVNRPTHPKTGVTHPVAYSASADPKTSVTHPVAYSVSTDPKTSVLPVQQNNTSINNKNEETGYKLQGSSKAEDDMDGHSSDEDSETEVKKLQTPEPFQNVTNSSDSVNKDGFKGEEHKPINQTFVNFKVENPPMSDLALTLNDEVPAEYYNNSLDRDAPTTSGQMTSSLVVPLTQSSSRGTCNSNRLEYANLSKEDDVPLCEEREQNRQEQQKSVSDIDSNPTLRSANQPASLPSMNTTREVIATPAPQPSSLPTHLGNQPAAAHAGAWSSRFASILEYGLQIYNYFE